MFAVFAGAMACIFIFALGFGTPERLRTLDPLHGQAISFFGATLPFALYFAFLESSRRQASLGKRLLGIQVTTLDGHRPGFGRALLRALVKFIPWMIGHMVPNQLLPQILSGRNGPMPGWLWGACVVAAGGALLYLVTLFVGDGRTPYDRVAGTRVVPGRPPSS